MKPTPENLAAINPATNKKYSPNLFKWMRKNRANDWKVYRHELTGRLWLGYFRKEQFNGCEIQAVMCKGTREEPYEQVSRTAVNLPPESEVVGFWERYIAIGRCAIDTDHSDNSWMWDRDGRWLVEGNRRSCQWCGNCVQEMHERKETRTFKEWRNSEAATQ